MEKRSIWHWVLVAVLLLVAFWIVRAILASLAHIFLFLLQVALVVAIIWVIYMIFARKRAY